MSNTERDRMAEVIDGANCPRYCDAREFNLDPCTWHMADALIAAGFGDVAGLTAERDALAAKVAAVEALHPSYLDPRDSNRGPWCEHCDDPWPCPTARALWIEAGQ